MKCHGHYCKVCGGYKANEKFSGKGHAPIYAKPAPSPPGGKGGTDDLAPSGKPAASVIQGGYYVLKNRLKDRRPAVRQMAEMIYAIRFQKRQTPEENQVVFYNTQQAIITEEVFEKVQQIRQQRHRQTKTGKSSMFSGLTFCADSGAKMRYSTTKDFEKRQDYFVCANYRKVTDKCSAHYIRAVVLEEMVWRHMQMVISYVANHEATSGKSWDRN